MELLWSAPRLEKLSVPRGRQKAELGHVDARYDGLQNDPLDSEARRPRKPRDVLACSGAISGRLLLMIKRFF
jgi:hypothetical protein